MMDLKTFVETKLLSKSEKMLEKMGAAVCILFKKKLCYEIYIGFSYSFNFKLLGIGC
jgi:hypothetical protein